MSDFALFSDLNARTLRGLILPFNELSRPSVSKTEPVMFAKGTVTIPTDPSALNVNKGHSQFSPAARFASVTETDAGLVAEMTVPEGPEGDELLLSASDPDESKRPRLSAEIADLVRDGAKAISSRLTGAAFVPMGAFASAALFELDEAEAEVLEDELEDRIKTAVAEALAAATQTPEAAPAEEPKEGRFAMTNPVTPAGAKAPAKTANHLFSAIASRDFDALKGFSVPDNVAAFAIENLQHSGPSSATIGADTQDTGYLGEIWSGNPYQRKFVPLFDVKPLTSYKATGWKWDSANSPEVGTYAGNGAEVHSNALDTIPVEVIAQRVAGGNRLDRRYLDFNDQTAIASYFSKLAEHYARFTDAAALAAAVAAAGTDLTVTGKSYPYGSPAAIAAIVDGALQVLSEDATPNFAVVSPELWRTIALIGKNDVLGYLQAGFGLESGAVDGFKIIPGAVGTGKVLVGAKQGLQFFEFGGSPIRVDAMAVHNGALDGALYGYYATLDTGLGLSLVDTTDYTAPTPPTTIVVEA